MSALDRYKQANADEKLRRIRKRGGTAAAHVPKNRLDAMYERAKKEAEQKGKKIYG